MDFLEKLYENNLFAPVLFAIIAILAVLFIIVLILALKDSSKNKSVKMTSQTQDAFNQVNEVPTTVNTAPVDNAAPVINNNQAPVQDGVISNVTPTASGFENVNVAAPASVDMPVVVEPNDNPIVDSQNIEVPTSGSNFVENNNVSFESVDTPIQTESSPVASVEDVKKAETDLDEIASTLLAEYQKEAPVEEMSAPEVNLPRNNTVINSNNEQFSSVFVTPNTLPSETNTSVASTQVPSLNDIPAPQPVRVVSQSTVIDSSKQNSVNVNNIENETYNLNK